MHSPYPKGVLMYYKLKDLLRMTLKIVVLWFRILELVCAKFLTISEKSMLSLEENLKQSNKDNEYCKGTVWQTVVSIA